MTNQSASSNHILILGGTADARKLVILITSQCGPNVRVTTSLAGRTKRPVDLAGDVRIGGFGGTEGMVNYLVSENVTHLIDATHPFAATISAHAVSATQKAAIPRLMIVRPCWQLPDGLKVVRVASMTDAAAILRASNTGRVLLTTGIQNLDAFSRLSEIFFMVRLIESPEKPLALDHASVIIQKPPFTLEGERKLMEENRIDTLVSKQSGGSATEAKLLAAAALGIGVVLIDRPPVPEGESVASPEDAAVWLQAFLGRST